MSVLYGKVRIYGESGQTITIIDGKGNSRNIQTTGQDFTDIVLPGMEEYTLSNPVNSVDITLNIGDFKEIELPTITLEIATWEQVKNIIQSGNFSNLASVGETKSFVINGKTYHAEVVAINDGTGDAGSWYPDKTVDFICKELYETQYAYTSGSNRNAGGFPSSGVKTTLNSTIYPLLPTDLKTVIIEKSHSYQAGSYSNSSWSSQMTTLATKLWLPTYYEIAGSTYQYAPGETAANNKAYILESAAKELNGGSGSYWWLGSPKTDSSGQFWCVGSNGSIQYQAASVSYGVPICFRIG